MSKLRKGAVIAATMAAVALMFWRLQGRQLDADFAGLSLSTDASERGRGPASLQDEAFSFLKFARVNFDFSQEVVEHSFEGQLFMDWTAPGIATVTMTMPGHEIDVFIKARFTDDHTLKCMEVPKGLTEKEADYVHLIKNLVLDYSFRTNRDENGEYLVKVTERADLITKIKSRYVGKNEIKVEKSLHEIKFNSSLAEAKGEEVYQLLFKDPAQGAERTAGAKTSYRLVALQGIKGPALSVEREMGECSFDFAQTAPPLAQIGPEEFSKLMNELASASRSAKHDHMRKMLKSLRAHPELLSELMDWIHSIKNDRKLSALGVGMLGSLGTPEAQKELIGLFQGVTEETAHLHQQVLNTFTLTEGALSGESRQFLRGQISGPAANLAEGAAYALGSGIQNDPESEDSQKDLSFLMYGLEQSGTAQSKLIYLDALGNSSSKEAIAAFEKYAASDDEMIREKAKDLLTKARTLGSKL